VVSNQGPAVGQRHGKSVGRQVKLSTGWQPVP
jgi:hypothetical protein